MTFDFCDSVVIFCDMSQPDSEKKLKVVNAMIRAMPS